MPIEPTGLSTTDQHKTTENSQVKVARSEPTVPQQETGSANATDTVTLTDIATRLNKLEEDLLTLPIVDTQRVEDIKRLVDQGKFEIDTVRTAEKFMDFELQLVS